MWITIYIAALIRYNSTNGVCYWVRMAEPFEVAVRLFYAYLLATSIFRIIPYGEHSSTPDPLQCARAWSHTLGAVRFCRGLHRERPQAHSVAGRGSLAQWGLSAGRPGGGYLHLHASPGSHVYAASIS